MAAQAIYFCYFAIGSELEKNWLYYLHRHSDVIQIVFRLVIGAFVKVSKLMATQSLQWAPLYSLFGQLISPVGQSSTKIWNGYSWLTIYFHYLHRHLYDLRRVFRLQPGYNFKVTNPMEVKEIKLFNISGLDTDGYPTCPFNHTTFNMCFDFGWCFHRQGNECDCDTDPQMSDPLTSLQQHKCHQSDS